MVKVEEEKSRSTRARRELAFERCLRLGIDRGVTGEDAGDEESVGRLTKLRCRPCFKLAASSSGLSVEAIKVAVLPPSLLVRQRSSTMGQQGWRA